MLGLVFLAGTAFGADLPANFDLRAARGVNYVSAVKSQSGGTCWTHGTMASIESNLMVTGTWRDEGETGEPNLAEYHLDWWNGFNKSWNPDLPGQRAGLDVHQGGDYRLAAAYLGRGEGVVRDVDGQSYNNPPTQRSSQYHYYYVRDIEWLTAGADLSNIGQIKQTLIDGGAIGTALTWSSSFYNSSRNTFYQPRTSRELPNHAVTIVGWDDSKQTQASQPGAWLVKNSWGSSWGDRGYFWISYHDKISAQHDQMGAVAFRNVERMHYDKVYYHDNHGWRDTKNATEAFNVFTAQGGKEGTTDETLTAVSFYTTADATDVEIKIYTQFANGQLGNELASHTVSVGTTGFHTVDLEQPVTLPAGQKFYVYLKVSRGGLAYDHTSDVPLLLGGGSKVIVESRAAAGESYYLKNGVWTDFTTEERTGNFCIKALVNLN